MSSYEKGKKEIRDYIILNLPQGSTGLDVGACDGEYWNLLHDHLILDGCEVFIPNIIEHHLTDKYRTIHPCNILGLEYDYYDIVIFGDVIEHMTVEDARASLEYAKHHSSMIVVAVPFLFKQDAIYGNEYERHIQDDLTDAIFNNRYQGFEKLYDFGNYAYYVWKKL